MFSLKTDVIWNVIELTGRTFSTSPNSSGSTINANEANEMLESVRHLPKVRSPIAKARAWLRLAMMKKKLPECIQSLLDNRHSIPLTEYYEPYALLMSEEAVILAGLLVGLNSFDYTVVLKDPEAVAGGFEHEPVLDLQYYLQEPYSLAEATQVPTKKSEIELLKNGDLAETNGDEDVVDNNRNVEVLMEQNSYLEEINTHLK